MISHAIKNIGVILIDGAKQGHVALVDSEKGEIITKEIIPARAGCSGVFVKKDVQQIQDEANRMLTFGRNGSPRVNNIKIGLTKTKYDEPIKLSEPLEKLVQPVMIILNPPKITVDP